MRIRNGARAGRPRAGGLPRERRRRPGDGEPRRRRRARRGDRLHALRARELAPGRAPRDGPGPAPRGRRAGLPQVVVPGCVDFFNQGAPDTVPERYRGRKSYYHNPVATLVRIEPDEMAELGRLVAGRLNEARGNRPRARPTRVLARGRGGRRPLVPGGRRCLRGGALGGPCGRRSSSSRGDPRQRSRVRRPGRRALPRPVARRPRPRPDGCRVDAGRPAQGEHARAHPARRGCLDRRSRARLRRLARSRFTATSSASRRRA